MASDTSWLPALAPLATPSTSNREPVAPLATFPSFHVTVRSAADQVPPPAAETKPTPAGNETVSTAAEAVAGPALRHAYLSVTLEPPAAATDAGEAVSSTTGSFVAAAVEPPEKTCSSATCVSWSRAEADWQSVLLLGSLSSSPA